MRTLLLATLFASSASAQFTTLVQVGDPIPSTDINFADLEAPVIGPDGEIAFAGLFEGSLVTLTADEDEGIFYYELNGDEVRGFLVHREGETLASAPGPSPLDRDFRILADGRLVMRMQYMGSPGANLGIWTWTPGAADATLEVIARGAIEPGSFQWGFLSSLRAGPSGNRFGFEATIINPDEPSRTIRGFGVAGTGGVPRVSMTNLPADPNPTYSRFDMRAHRGNGTGVIAVAGRVSPVVGDSVDTVFVDGVPTIMDSDHGLDDFEVAGINDEGQVLVIGSAGTPPSTVRSLWLLESDTTFTQIAAPGDDIQATGLEGATFDPTSFGGGRVLLGGSGHVVVVAVHESGESILLRDPDDTWHLVASEGDTVGELTLDTLLPGANTIGTNAQGNVVFRATASAQDSLWGYDRSEGELVRLLNVGQEISVGGEPHRLTDFEVRLGSGGQDGSATAYNDDGEIALILKYEPIAGGDGITVGGCAMGNAPINGAGRPGGPLPPGDAGPGADGGPGSDAGPGSDTGTGVDAGSEGGSGGCSTSGQSSAPLALLFLLLVARRRR